ARPLFDVEGFVPPSTPRDSFLGALADGELAVRYWTFDHQFERFTFDSCADLRSHPRCTIVTHATVREVVAFQSARGVQGLDVVGPSGQSLSVKAHAFGL